MDNKLTKRYKQNKAEQSYGVSEAVTTTPALIVGGLSAKKHYDKIVMRRNVPEVPVSKLISHINDKYQLPVYAGEQHPQIASMHSSFYYPGGQLGKLLGKKLVPEGHDPVKPFIGLQSSKEPPEILLHELGHHKQNLKGLSIQKLRLPLALGSIPLYYMSRKTFKDSEGQDIGKSTAYAAGAAATAFGPTLYSEWKASHNAMKDLKALGAPSHYIPEAGKNLRHAGMTYASILGPLAIAGTLTPLMAQKYHNYRMSHGKEETKR